jgi:hypothetical protein
MDAEYPISPADMIPDIDILNDLTTQELEAVFHSLDTEQQCIKRCVKLLGSRQDMIIQAQGNIVVLLDRRVGNIRQALKNRNGKITEELAHIYTVLGDCNWHRDNAARALGMHRSTLWEKTEQMKALGWDLPWLSGKSKQKGGMAMSDIVEGDTVGNKGEDVEQEQKVDELVIGKVVTLEVQDTVSE